MIAWLSEHITLCFAGARGIESKAATVVDGLRETARNGTSPKPTFYKAVFFARMVLSVTHAEILRLFAPVGNEPIHAFLLVQRSGTVSQIVDVRNLASQRSAGGDPRSEFHGPVSEVFLVHIRTPMREVIFNIGQAEPVPTSRSGVEIGLAQVLAAPPGKGRARDQSLWFPMTQRAF